MKLTDGRSQGGRRGDKGWIRNGDGAFRGERDGIGDCLGHPAYQRHSKHELGEAESERAVVQEWSLLRYTASTAS